MWLCPWHVSIHALDESDFRLISIVCWQTSSNQGERGVSLTLASYLFEQHFAGVEDVYTPNSFFPALTNSDRSIKPLKRV